MKCTRRQRSICVVDAVKHACVNRQLHAYIPIASHNTLKACLITGCIRELHSHAQNSRCLRSSPHNHRHYTHTRTNTRVHTTVLPAPYASSSLHNIPSRTIARTPTSFPFFQSPPDNFHKISASSFSVPRQPTSLLPHCYFIFIFLV